MGSSSMGFKYLTQYDAKRFDRRLPKLKYKYKDQIQMFQNEFSKFQNLSVNKPREIQKNLFVKTNHYAKISSPSCLRVLKYNLLNSRFKKIGGATWFDKTSNEFFKILPNFINKQQKNYKKRQNAIMRDQYGQLIMSGQQNFQDFLTPENEMNQNEYTDEEQYYQQEQKSDQEDQQQYQQHLDQINNGGNKIKQLKRLGKIEYSDFSQQSSIRQQTQNSSSSQSEQENNSENEQNESSSFFSQNQSNSFVNNEENQSYTQSRNSLTSEESKVQQEQEEPEIQEQDQYIQQSDTYTDTQSQQSEIRSIQQDQASSLSESITQYSSEDQEQEIEQVSKQQPDVEYDTKDPRFTSENEEKSEDEEIEQYNRFKEPSESKLNFWVQQSKLIQNGKNQESEGGFQQYTSLYKSVVNQAEA